MFENYRYPGEFERVSDVFMSWLPDYVDAGGYDNRKTCVEIVGALAGHARLHINCGSEGILEKCRKRLEEGGIDTSQIIFTQFEDTNFYVRDNGPSIMVNDKGGKIAINPNWSYYGVWDPEGEESLVARRAGMHMALSLGCFDIINSDLVSEGGDREFNGDGIMIAIEDTECRKRNPRYTKEQVEEEYKRLYNLRKIIWLPKPILEDDDYRIGPLEYKDGVPVFGSSFAAHADEMCRFVGRNKILLAEVTEEEAANSKANQVTKERLDEAYEILSKATDAHGNPFEIVRMPVTAPIEYVLKPDDPDYDMYKSFLDDGKFWDGTPWPDGDVHFYASTSYCNFLMCNDVVLTQKYYREGLDPVIKEKDEKAKAVFEKCFPDRKIVTIDTLALNMSGGGIHCWTKEVGAAQ